MRFVGLLLAIGMVVSCGTDTSYTRTLANEESPQQETGTSSSKVLTITGAGIGVVVAACVAANLKKRCIPFVKKIARIGENGKPRKAVDSPTREVPQEELDEVLEKAKKAEQRKPSSDSNPKDTARTKPDSGGFNGVSFGEELRQSVKAGKISEEQAEYYWNFDDKQRIWKLIQEGKLGSESI